MDFKIQKSNHRVSISIDPEIAAPLISTLEMLLELTKLMKKAAGIRQAYERAADPARRAAQRAHFEDISRKVYSRHKDLLKTALRPSEAVQLTKAAFNLGYEDTVIYIREGRRLEKLEKRRESEF